LIELDDEKMNYLKYKRGDLTRLYSEMLNRLGLIESLKLNIGKLNNFVREVSDSYNEVPYHNFTHAFNIAH
jgi:hypothetical protein